MKMWQKPDILMAGEGSLGYQVLDQSAVFNVTLRWQQYTRRGEDAGTTATDSEVLFLGVASLVF
jgi:hypothetical protein